MHQKGTRVELDELLEMAWDGQRKKRKWAEAHPDIPHSTRPTTQQTPEPKKFRWDITLACLFALLGIVVVVMPPTDRFRMLGCLIAMFVLGVYPAFHFAQWLPVMPKTVSKVLGILLLAVCVSWIGYVQWPPVKRHFLSVAEIEEFQRPLNDIRDNREQIELMCPATVEEDCTYAAQFINIFRQVGWSVKGNEVQRIGMAIPRAGIVLFKRNDGQPPDPNQWNSGTWVAISDSLMAVRSAFVQIGIEPDFSAGPQLPENHIAIYFGIEKPDEGEKTDLTRAAEMNENAKKAFGGRSPH